MNENYLDSDEQELIEEIHKVNKALGKVLIEPNLLKQKECSISFG